MTLPGTEIVSRDHLYLSAAPAAAAPAGHKGQPGDLDCAAASTGSAASRTAMVFIRLFHDATKAPTFHGTRRRSRSACKSLAPEDLGQE